MTNSHGVPLESQRWERGRAVTPSSSRPVAMLRLPSEVGSISRGIWGWGVPWQLGIPACSLILLHLARAAQRAPHPGPGGHLCCSGQPSAPSPAGTHLTVPEETSDSMAGQEANIFVSPGTRFQELGPYPPSTTVPRSRSARPARCSAISRHTWSWSGPGS